MKPSLEYSETKRLILRRPTQDLYKTLFRWLKDPELTKYVGGVREDDKIQLTFDHVMKSWNTAGVGKCLVIEKDTLALVGLVGIFPLDLAGTKVNDLGYLIDSPFSGKGYATEASEEIVRKGFLDHGMDQISAWPDPKNASSVRVVEKLGFQFVKELNGAYMGMSFSGMHLYKLSRSHWQTTVASHQG
ncbi:GNAT family N-acetyltransferase [bacterium]|nr:GNAT family N-acetyltransferase [bacterium]